MSLDAMVYEVELWIVGNLREKKKLANSVVTGGFCALAFPDSQSD